VRDPKRRTAVEVDENHGLWDFFSESRAALMTPTELASHGRGWYVQELRRKDWDDLHRLWWVCVKETNRIKTFKAERERIGKMYGDYEADARLEEVCSTFSSVSSTIFWTVVQSFQLHLSRSSS
jgi:large subunit ribosomal protein L47